MDIYFDITLIICCKLLENGAEISRVEDTAKRILESYGYKNISVFCISSLIIIDSGGKISAKRINKNDINLSKIDYLNQLSRAICEKKKIVYNNSAYPLPVLILACISGCGAFTLYFGGSFYDALFSSLIGVIINFRKSFITISFAKTLTDSFLGGVLSYISASFIPFLHSDKIMIGTIMLLVPGITTTNGVKDIMKSDILSGIIELTEAVFTALAIALGYSAVSVLL